MTNNNFDILKKNISNLMKEKCVTQQQLAELTGMTQSNISKCLKLGDDSRCFTLEQVCSIADYFNKSIDELMERKSCSNDLCPEYICDFLMKMISNYTIVHFDHTVTEKVSSPYINEYGEHDTIDQPITYDAFYFPSYITPPDYLDEYRRDELEADVRANGNEKPDNIRINNFLHKYIEAFEKFDCNAYDKETYDILIDAYLKILKK